MMTNRRRDTVDKLVDAVNDLTDQHAADQKHIAALEQQVELQRADEELLERLLAWWRGEVPTDQWRVNSNGIDRLIAERKRPHGVSRMACRGELRGGDGGANSDVAAGADAVNPGEAHSLVTEWLSGEAERPPDAMIVSYVAEALEARTHCVGHGQFAAGHLYLLDAIRALEAIRDR